MVSWATRSRWVVFKGSWLTGDEDKVAIAAKREKAFPFKLSNASQMSVFVNPPDDKDDAGPLKDFQAKLMTLSEFSISLKRRAIPTWMWSATR